MMWLISKVSWLIYVGDMIKNTNDLINKTDQTTINIDDIIDIDDSVIPFLNCTQLYLKFKFF